MQASKPPSTGNVVAFHDWRRARATARQPAPGRRQAVVVVSDPDRPRAVPRPAPRARVLPAADQCFGGDDGVPMPLDAAVAPPATPAGPHLDRGAARLPNQAGVGLRLLLVDGDALARQEVAQVLEALLQASTRPVGGVGDALDALAAERFDAAILEVGLPDGDGCDLCAAIRARGLAMPVVMLTGLEREADMVRGFEAGAHDYVVKPFRPRELAARVRAHLRLFEASDHAEVRVGNQTFHSGKRMLSEPGQPRPVRLSLMEAALLRHLHRANGEMVSRKDLLRHVWGYNAGAETATVATHVYRLRCKVEPRADSPRILFSEPGGYRLLRPAT